MAKELPYFKFITSEWLDGEITLEELETQGLFINICALYWSKEGRIYLSKLRKRFRYASQNCFDALINEGFIQVENDLVFISFLDEQMKERKAKSLKNSENGKKGGRPRKATQNQTQSEKKPNAFENESELKPIRREEKREEEKRKEENKTLLAANAEKLSKKEEYEFLFNVFWDKYNKKVDRHKCLLKWHRLTEKEIEQVFQHVEKYVESTPDKQFRKNPLSYLNAKSFQNEIIDKTATVNEKKSVSTRYREAWEKANQNGGGAFDSTLY